MGLKTVCVEKRGTLGGTCLNVGILFNLGCIPSKALLDSTEHYHQAKEKFALHGITTGDLSVDIKQMMKRKKSVIDNTTAGIDYLLKKNNITRYEGMASFVENQFVIRDEFKALKKIFDELKLNYFSQESSFNTLSMGMSGDYHIAIEEGSNMIRVGSSIFGKRV